MVWFFIRLNLSKPHPRSTALAFGMLYTLRLRKNSEMRMADNPLYEDRPDTREQFRTSAVLRN